MMLSMTAKRLRRSVLHFAQGTHDMIARCTAHSQRKHCMALVPVCSGSVRHLVINIHCTIEYSKNVQIPFHSVSAPCMLAAEC